MWLAALPASVCLAAVGFCWIIPHRRRASRRPGNSTAETNRNQGPRALQPQAADIPTGAQSHKPRWFIEALTPCEPTTHRSVWRAVVRPRHHHHGMSARGDKNHAMRCRSAFTGIPVVKIGYIRTNADLGCHDGIHEANWSNLVIK